MKPLTFTSDENDGYTVFPFVELQERTTAQKSPDKIQFSLPAELCGLNEPTLDESLGVLRFLAFRLARVLYISEWPSGFAWYQSYYEDTTFDDCLEVATILLASLNTKIVAVSELGEITVEFLPIIEEIEQFLLEDFAPIAHYLRSANPDAEEDFEYDFDDAFIGIDALKKIYSFVIFSKKMKIIDLDPILKHGTDEDESDEIVAVRKNGISELTPKREFSQPLDRILTSLISVIHFFSFSSEYGELFAGFSDDDDPSIEELESDRREYIEEFPDEEDVADSIFEDRAHGELQDFHFLTSSSVLYALGISSIAAGEDGWISATLNLQSNPQEYLTYLGGRDASGEDDPFYEFEPVGQVRLGWYEYYFFSPEEEEEELADD